MRHLLRTHDVSVKWLHDVREMVHEKLSVNHTKHDNFTIAVHIRRGDVALNARLKDRYLDNAYFLRAIEAAMRPGARVFIYSEGKPSEFSEFTALGYELRLKDTGLPATFREMILADVFIMSKSSFSYFSDCIRDSIPNKTLCAIYITRNHPFHTLKKY